MLLRKLWRPVIAVRVLQRQSNVISSSIRIQSVNRTCCLYSSSSITVPLSPVSSTPKQVTDSVTTTPPTVTDCIPISTTTTTSTTIGGTCTGNTLSSIDSPVQVSAHQPQQQQQQPEEILPKEEEDEAPMVLPTTVSGQIKYYIQAYASLSKWKLSALVLATTMWGYAMAPGAVALAPFCASLVGTGMTIASAATINQIIEIDNDARMYRTRKRWLPAGRIGVTHASIYAGVVGIAGVGSLFYLANPTAASLALFNHILYTAIYTPMKQQRPLNTYVGAIVGAIPPMIGWAACSELDAGAWVLGALLAVWQIPHFMALSWSLKDDYARGGFKMLINLDPTKVPGVVLAYSAIMSTIGIAAAMTDVTTFAFAIDSMIPNGIFTYAAYQFYKNPSRESARKVFRYSLLILPVLMGMMWIHKKDTPEQNILYNNTITTSTDTTSTDTTTTTTTVAA